eukprot:Em0019g1068a
MWHADGAVQKRLLGKADLTFAKALEVAELEEMAARDAAQLHEGQPKDVHCMSGPPRRGGNRDNPGTPTGPCYRCGRNHLPNQCRFQWERCRFCKLQGHAERVCRKKMKAESMREASWIKELKGDSIGLTLKTAQMGKRFMEWKSHPAIHSNSGRHTNQCMFSLRTRVEKEEEGIIAPVSTSDGATPVVVAPKKDGSIRLCGDFRMTVNQAIKVDKYPLPLIEDIFASLGGSTMFNAISRLPLTEATEVERQDREELDDCPEFRLNQLEQIPVTTAVLRDATAKDSVLSRVLKYIQVGWPVDIPEELKSFRDKRGELAPEQGCLLLGIRVVIPASLQRKVLDEIHDGHLGVVKMTCPLVLMTKVDKAMEYMVAGVDRQNENEMANEQVEHVMSNELVVCNEQVEDEMATEELEDRMASERVEDMMASEWVEDMMASEMEDSQKLEDEVTSEEVKDEMGEIQVEDT